MNLKPVFQLGLFYKERSGREDKLGGLPFGLPLDRWPKCAVCGQPQNYLAQFRNSDMVDLGRNGTTLFLFQCPDGALCGAWDYKSGANAAVLIDQSKLTAAVTMQPDGTEVEPEGIIVGWEPIDPKPSVSYAGPEPSYGANHPVSSDPTGRFLIQLVGSLGFNGPPPTPSETGAQHRYYRDGKYGLDNVRVEDPPNPRQHYGKRWSRGQSDYPGRPSQIIVLERGDWSVEWANFGGGTAYVYMDENAGRAFFFSEI